MSQNLRLVSYFVSEFYHNKMIELEHITSPNFSFTLHTEKKQTFKEFAERMSYVTENAKLEIGDIRTQDDVYFYASAELSIPTGDAEDYIVHGENRFMVKNGLLDEVKVTYDLCAEDFIVIQQLLVRNALKPMPRVPEMAGSPAEDELLFI